MFRFPQRANSRTAAPERPPHLLRRAALFGAGLLLLWVALQLVPQRPPASVTAPVVEASMIDDGVVVRSNPASPQFFSAGTVAVFLLLAGGAGFALFLRRRAKEGAGAAMPLQSIGQMSLAPNQQLRLVRCGGDILLLGVTSGQITLLKAYDAVAFETGVIEAEAAANPADLPAPDETSFARLLRRQLGGSFIPQKSEAPC